jgi:hypothetical protein
MTLEQIRENPAAFVHSLGHFTGTESYYRTINRSIVLTDGAKHVADECECHWFIDKIATLQLERKIARERFQVWKLVVNGSAAKLIVEDGNDHQVYSEEIEFTDFPLPEFSFWCAEDGVIGQGVKRVIMIPSEY